MNPFEVQASEQRVFDFLEQDPIFQRVRFARMTSEPMLSLIRPRIEQLVHDRVELELIQAMPLLAEQLFDDIWKEKLNNDVEGFVCRTLDEYLAVQEKLNRLLEFFGIESEAEEVAYTDQDPADWWRGEGDDEGPTELEWPS